MTPDQLRTVEMLCATADWGFPPETAEALRAVVKDAKRYAALAGNVQASGLHMDGTAIYRVRHIPGRHVSFDAAVDSLIEKGAQGK